MNRYPSRRIGVAGLALLVCLGAIDVVHAQRIGRLFSNPDQRRELDAIRSDPDFGKAPSEVVVTPESTPGSTPISPVRTVTINGMVLRSDGYRVSWVNGIAVDTETVTAERVWVEMEDIPGNRTRIRLSEGSPAVDLEPGQWVEVGADRIFDAYERSSASGAAARSADRTVGEGTGEWVDVRGIESDHAAEPVRSIPVLPAAPDGSSPGSIVPPLLPASLVTELLRRAQTAHAAVPASAAFPASTDRTSDPRPHHDGLRRN